MKKIIFVFAIIALCACNSNKQEKLNANKVLNYCASQVRRTLKELNNESSIDYTLMPRNILNNQSRWNLRKATKEEWTAGFWPGILWYDYEHTQDPVIRDEAEKFTASLEFLSRIPAYDHDLGFLIFCSYGNGYRLTGNPHYKEVILATADTLATLFNPTVGTILSWPRETESRNWPHNTIMDNMINLEMLFWAAKHGDNKNLYDVGTWASLGNIRIHHLLPGNPRSEVFRFSSENNRCLFEELTRRLYSLLGL